MKNKKSVIFTIFILFFFNILLSNQDVVNDKLERDVEIAEAWGYLYGQEFFLDKISKKFPSLNAEVENTKKKFSFSFGKAKNNLEKEMIEVYGDQELKSLKAENYDYFNKFFPQNLDKEIAKIYLAEVKLRAKGKAIDNNIRRTLLSYEYLNKPHGEFLNGFTKEYCTKGKSKSLGLNITIKIPESWLGQEANGKHIIRKFINQNGRGMASIMLIVENIEPILQEIDKTKSITKEDMLELFIDGENTLLLKEIEIDNYTFIVTESYHEKEKLGIDFTMVSINYIAIIQDNVFFLQCMVGGSESTVSIEDEVDKYIMLFNLVANSIKINE